MTKALPTQFRSGMSALAIDTFISEAEHMDYGTKRWPWPTAIKSKIKRALVPCRDLPEMRTKLNEVVVAELGVGYLGRGPFPL